MRSSTWVTDWAGPSRDWREMQDQRRVALDRANEIRSARARFKKQMRDTVPVSAIAKAAEEVVHPEPAMLTMKLEPFLSAIPRVGKVTSRRLLHESQVNKGTLGRLSERQRGELVRALDQMAQRRYGTTIKEAP